MFAFLVESKPLNILALISFPCFFRGSSSGSHMYSMILFSFSYPIVGYSDALSVLVAASVVVETDINLWESKNTGKLVLPSVRQLENQGKYATRDTAAHWLALPPQKVEFACS